ncbi:hypothetical protein OO013_19410 [Mangrovivirga sp. M17]|uniref:Uncharacterized protein n=1 Tax=Mangrovivirga halotolerans TaxID=2993936 RepID=A0ABT3RWA4_9BACT|nr:hypothetical protein [Mangrovivirga halotolerans]MCX2746057.1 hypothetical protein [Mangrovivirga halotolerans]
MIFEFKLEGEDTSVYVLSARLRMDFLKQKLGDDFKIANKDDEIGLILHYEATKFAKDNLSLNGFGSINYCLNEKESSAPVYKIQILK